VRQSRRGAHRSSAAAWDGSCGRGALRHGTCCRGNASLRPLGRPEDHRTQPLHESQGRSARRRAAPRDLRAARPYRHPGGRAAHRPVEPGVLFSASFIGAVDLVAVLARREHRAEVIPHRRLRRDAAHRDPRTVRQLGRIPAPCRHLGRRRADRGRDEIVVGSASERAFSDARERITDSCTNFEDSLSIAALFAASCACCGA
jgi:hypothetical protein